MRSNTTIQRNRKTHQVWLLILFWIPTINLEILDVFLLRRRCGSRLERSTIGCCQRTSNSRLDLWRGGKKRKKDPLASHHGIQRGKIIGRQAWTYQSSGAASSCSSNLGREHDGRYSEQDNHSLFLLLLQSQKCFADGRSSSRRLI